MLNTDAIKNAIPREDILKELIRPDFLNIILDDSIGADLLECFIGAFNSFEATTKNAYMVSVIGNKNAMGSYTNLFKQYGVSEKFTFVSDDDNISLLTYYLASDVLFTKDTSMDSVKLSKDLYVPVIALEKDLSEVYFNEEEGIFHIDESDAGISAASLIIHEKKYRNLFSGFPKLVKEDC